MSESWGRFLHGAGTDACGARGFGLCQGCRQPSVCLLNRGHEKMGVRCRLRCGCRGGRDVPVGQRRLPLG